MFKKIGLIIAAALMTVGLSAGMPQAPAATYTAYTWVHEWSTDGVGVTVQYSYSGFVRTSYVHGGSCTEEKIQFWSSGNVATYRRYSPTSSCSGVAWTLMWTTPSAGASSSLSWQHDLNWVLRDQQGNTVWASGTNWVYQHYCCERTKLGNNANGYLYLDHNYAGVWWADKRYPA